PMCTKVICPPPPPSTPGRRFLRFSPPAVRACFALLVALGCRAVPASASQAGFAFLEVPAGARAAALGGAYSSVAKGAEAAFWHPAGLAEFDGSQFAATHTETYTHLRHDQVALAGRMFGGGIAGSLRA